MIKKLPSKHIYALIGLFVANLIWAWAPPIIKATLEHIPLFAFLFYRFLLVCILLLPFLIYEIHKNPVDKRDWLNLLLLGLSGQASIVFIFWGLQYTTSLDTTIIGLIGPMLTITAGHYFFKESINSHIKIGLIIATIGAALVVFEPLIGQGLGTDVSAGSRLFGNGLILLYNILFLLYVIWSKMSLAKHQELKKKELHFLHLKPFKKNYSSFFLSTITFYVALAVCIPLAIREYMQGNMYSITQLDLAGFMGLIYMAIFSSILAYIVFAWSLDKSTVGDTAFFSYLHPLMALPLAYILLGELPTQLNLIGCGIIFIGVIIAERKNT